MPIKVQIFAETPDEFYRLLAALSPAASFKEPSAVAQGAPHRPAPEDCVQEPAPEPAEEVAVSQEEEEEEAPAGPQETDYDPFASGPRDDTSVAFIGGGKPLQSAESAMEGVRLKPHQKVEGPDVSGEIVCGYILVMVRAKGGSKAIVYDDTDGQEYCCITTDLEPVTTAGRDEGPEAPVEEKAPPASNGKSVTAEDVKTALMEVRGKHGATRASTILRENGDGATKISMVPEEKLKAVYDAARAAVV